MRRIVRTYGRKSHPAFDAAGGGGGGGVDGSLTVDVNAGVGLGVGLGLGMGELAVKRETPSIWASSASTSNGVTSAVDKKSKSGISSSKLTKIRQPTGKGSATSVAKAPHRSWSGSRQCNPQLTTTKLTVAKSSGVRGTASLETRSDFSTTQSALDLVESGDIEAKLENLKYIMAGFRSKRTATHRTSARHLIEATIDPENRCGVL